MWYGRETSPLVLRLEAIKISSFGIIPRQVYTSHSNDRGSTCVGFLVTKSVYTQQYRRFRALLIQARKAAGLTQVELAAQLQRPQSYVSKVERGERRLDVIEFLEVARALQLDVVAFLHQLDAW